jgi:hypothetical protein
MTEESLHGKVVEMKVVSVTMTSEREVIPAQWLVGPDVFVELLRAFSSRECYNEP